MNKFTEWLDKNNIKYKKTSSTKENKVYIKSEDKEKVFKYNRIGKYDWKYVMDGKYILIYAHVLVW